MMLDVVHGIKNWRQYSGISKYEKLQYFYDDHWLVLWNILFIFSVICGNFIIPTDELIFFKMGRSTTNQFMMINIAEFPFFGETPIGWTCYDDISWASQRACQPLKEDRSGAIYDDFL